MSKANPNGLTWLAWHAATMIPISPNHKCFADQMHEAWRQGEDPTEWRAWFASMDREDQREWIGRDR